MIGRIITASTTAPARIVEPVLDACPAKIGMNPRCAFSQTVSGSSRADDDDAPQPEDDGGDCSEKVDQVAEDPGQATRRVVRDEEGDADRDRGAENQGDQGNPEGSEDQWADVVPEAGEGECRALVQVGVRLPVGHDGGKRLDD
jgi:hypothetical protein